MRCKSYTFDNHLTGIASIEFPYLWEDLRKTVEGKTLGKDACPYHAQNEGCILGTLKPARCASHVEQDDQSLEAILKIHGHELQSFLAATLRHAMAPSHIQPITEDAPNQDISYI